jgi:two-component system, LytTR family, sensor kinase
MTDAEALEIGAPHTSAGAGDAARPWRRRWALVGIVFGSWTALALFFTGQLYYTYLLSEKPLTWRYAASQQFIYPYLWAVGTLVVLWLANRFPLEGRAWWRSAVFHLLSATFFVVLISGTFQIVFQSINSPEKPFRLSLTLQWIIFNSSENYGIYGLILLLNQVFRYYRRYREGELRASQLENRLTHAQLQALKMQLHPHFLFNTLHSISALLHRDPETADRMIARLGDFLRLTLDNSGAQEVSLQKELEFLKCYLDIERVRFQDRLTTSLDVEPRALDSRVPNLILQPIVENALRHGLSQRAAPGHLEISAKRDNGSLRIQVKDNGPGLSAITGSKTNKREGLGLSNTKARLEQLYGAAHRFSIENAPGGGLVVTLEIPAERDGAA